MERLQSCPPLAIRSGHDGWLIDESGRRYFDAISSWWVNILGHTNQRITAAIIEQANRLSHVMLGGCTHEPAVRLAERLAARTNHQLGHVFFASDGSSAVEIALKQCFHAKAIQGQGSKTLFACLRNSYHGETIGALSVTDVPLFQNAYRALLTDTLIVESPDSRDGNEGAALKALSNLLDERGDEIAALVIEPRVQCGGGMSMHSPEYLRKVRQMTRQHDVYLIADEIAVGCGRTGTFFAWEQVSKTDWPDIVLLSKGITGGNLPLSVVLSSEEIFQCFLSDDFTKGFLHSHSYTGNPLACAAANAVLDHFDEGLTDAIAQQAQYLSQAFDRFNGDSRVSPVRQCGMILAFEVNNSGNNFAERFHMQGRAHELLIRPIGNTVYLIPPYVLNQELAEFLANAVDQCLDKVLSGC
jgi:adenosylmethionine---8-amino-7-oxononanoate aminotransferase